MKMINIIIPIMAIASMPFQGIAQEQLKSGIKLENLDQTANPGNSFYQFACGGWIKNVNTTNPSSANIRTANMICK